VQGFAENGFEVDIYIDECSYERSPIVFSENNINIICVKLEDVPDIDLKELFSESVHDLNDFLEVNKIFPRYPMFLKNMILRARNISYDLVVGVEPFGLISAMLLAHLNPAPAIYYNLELYKESHCKHKEEYLLKGLEKQAARNCLLVIVPDAKRGAVLAAENQIKDSYIRFLPVSTKGEQVREGHVYFRRKFNILDDKKVLIYAGHFADWALCREIVASSNAWPDKYVLIMHTWQKDIRQNRYLDDLKRAAGSNVFFSLDPIPRDMFPSALSSADAGLLFYNQSDENNTETGSSSNKLTQYLKAGLPVIASDSISHLEIFDRFHCGVCVSSPFDIIDVLDDVFKNIDLYKDGVKRAFNEYYNFDIYFTPLFKEIEKYLNSLHPKMPCLNEHLSIRRYS
jgi:glycosyltransferase involved in cell wall biosynthesis